MANPAAVACAADTWVKVATAVQSGFVSIKDNTPDGWVSTYKLTGEAAPSDDTTAVPMYLPGASISASVDIDVYIKAINKAGSVVVQV